ncbi:MAG: SPFH domain-containing protein, partial [Verrucomicrobia bacterium]|nr:SPFH domain-containing protein [Verrucomicrobiota bacterium]
AKLETNIGLEEERKKLVALAAENAKAESDTRAYGISTTMQALASADAGVLQALATTGMKPQQLIAFAFQELAAKADKIGNLNISPELLSQLLANPGGKK